MEPRRRRLEGFQGVKYSYNPQRKQSVVEVSLKFTKEDNWEKQVPDILKQASDIQSKNRFSMHWSTTGARILKKTGVGPSLEAFCEEMAARPSYFS